MKRAIMALAATAVLGAGAAQAKTAFTVLHNFNHQSSFAAGIWPYGAVLDAPRGRLYMTLQHGGSTNCNNGCGTIVAVDLADRSAKVLHRFDSNNGQGTPTILPMLLDGDGTLYGTTSLVYSLAQNGQDTWQFGVVNNPGGDDQSSTLLADPASGTLYGLTCATGTQHQGQLYSLTPNAGKTAWTYAALFDFPGGVGGGCPGGSLTMDRAGHLYGIATGGGDFACESDGCGIVFQLFRSNGAWREHVLHAFTGLNGEGRAPQGGVVSDARGNLYGVTFNGGTYDQRCFNGCGTVYELVRSAKWSMTVLHQFDFDNGAAPQRVRLAIDARGNLFGTTQQGGPAGVGLPGHGTVFEIKKKKKSGFQFGVLHYFCADGNCTDGHAPVGGVVLDATGTLYGTTPLGGRDGDGIAFELTP